MKSIKQIREQYDLITEKEEKEGQKLTALVRAGLYDAKKLPALKKALEKSADKMSGQEKRMLINLLDSLINQVVSDDQVYRKVRQNVHMKEAKEEKRDTYSRYDDRFKKGWPSDKEMPSVLILKRKAIRVYPDNQKVALYYSQALDKYVTIPFSDIQTGLNEENLQELAPLAAIPAIAGAVARGTVAIARSPLGKKLASGAASVAGSVAKKGKDWGRKVLDKFKSKKKTDKPGASGKPPKPPKKKKRPDIDIEAGGIGSNNNDNTPSTSAGSSNVGRSPTPEYKFSGARQGKSSWEHRTSSNAVQRKRDEITNRRALTNENVFETVKTIVEQNIDESIIRFDEQEIKINNTVAKKLVRVYEAMNKTNKKKMETMLNESATSFNKVLTFAVRQ